MLDAKTERLITDAVERLRTLFRGRLVTVALYGSAVGTDYVPGVSDINLVIVLDAVSFPDLRALQDEVARWRKQRFATPLVLDQGFLRDAADVFPMELEDIRDHHRPLHGTDVFAAMAIQRDHLRYQCEHEARGKLLRLQGLYLELGGNRRSLQALLLESLKTFLIIMRNANRLGGVHEPGSYSKVLEIFARHFRCELPVMARLLRIKLSQEQWSGETDVTFRAYLDEVQRLVDVIDQLPADGSAVDVSI